MERRRGFWPEELQDDALPLETGRVPGQRVLAAGPVTMMASLSLSSVFTERPTRPLTRYALALAATGAALACRGALDPVLGDFVPYLTIFPAVIFSSWYCGLGPSIASVIIAFLAETYWFVEPRNTLGIPSAARLIGAAVYVIAAAFIVIWAEANRRSLAQVSAARGELERRVKERTRELEEKNAELFQQTETVRKLSGRLLQMRDEERKHIARELHDSAGQLSALIKTNLRCVMPECRTLAPKAVQALTETASLADQLTSEIRTISYLLHPPLLDEMGLRSALSWLVEGFSERSKIQVKLELPADFGRLPRDLEIHLFRIVQECLTNIHKHSGSPTARVCLTRGDNCVRLEVADAGKGIPQERLRALDSSAPVGVGVSGMRERARQFGGTIDITSTSQGTVVVAVIPLSSTGPMAVAASGSDR
jgi:signal transduction histidine kinase